MQKMGALERELLRIEGRRMIARGDPRGVLHLSRASFSLSLEKARRDGRKHPGPGRYFRHWLYANRDNQRIFNGNGLFQYWADRTPRPPVLKIPAGQTYFRYRPFG